MFISWINEILAVGPAFRKEDLENLKSEGIEAIVDLRSEASDDAAFIRALGMDFLHVEIDDCHPPTPQQLKEIIDFLRPYLVNNKKVFIHCQNGCGRSPLVVIAALVDRGMNLEDAIKQVVDRHPSTGFTIPQKEFILQL